MSNLLKRYKAWQLRRQQLSLEKWAKEREKGKERFVRRQTFFLAVFMTASRDVLSQLFFTSSHEVSLWINLLINLVTGYFVACWVWKDREGKYQEAQLKSSPPAVQLRR
jgi:hypothetical protein